MWSAGQSAVSSGFCDWHFAKINCLGARGGFSGFKRLSKPGKNNAFVGVLKLHIFWIWIALGNLADGPCNTKIKAI